MTDEPTHNPPPGWYDDPRTAHWLRYWDGDQWTDHEAPKRNLRPINPKASEAGTHWALGLGAAGSIGVIVIILFTFLRFIGYFGDGPLDLVASIPVT